MARALRHDGWTAARRAQFLEVLSNTANVTAAAAAVEMSKPGAYVLRRRDAGFARDWDEALASAADELEAVAFERARDGVEKTVVRAGGGTVTIREYSDRLLMFMLSRRRPIAHAHLNGARLEFAREREICAKIERRIAEAEARRGHRE